ncbi:MAG TPA: TIGR00725 family protein [Dissulfurispiraceae bacterium]|nr:TIGR00725 family protein [Dissulfurispiraceae bacterium]
MVKHLIGVIGAGRANDRELELAERTGKLIAEHGAILVCGGLGGVMEAAARGAKSAGGLTVGILPQPTKEMANSYIDVPIATGFGEGRNVIIIRTADVLITIGGEYGTLSELAFALKMGKPVIGINTWNIKGIIEADTPDTAIDKALQLLTGPHKGF